MKSRKGSICIVISLPDWPGFEPRSAAWQADDTQMYHCAPMENESSISLGGTIIKSNRTNIKKIEPKKIFQLLKLVLTSLAWF